MKILDEKRFVEALRHVPGVGLSNLDIAAWFGRENVGPGKAFAARLRSWTEGEVVRLPGGPAWRESGEDAGDAGPTRLQSFMSGPET